MSVPQYDDARTVKRARKPPTIGLTGRALREATVAECRRRVREQGGSVDERFTTDWLRESQRLDSEYSKVCARLMSACENAISAAEAYKHERFNTWSASGELLVSLAKRVDRLSRGWSLARAPRSSRAYLIETFDRAELLGWNWWGDRRPTRTELAVQSILVGHWTKYANNRASTPAEAIEAEARNLDHAARSIGRKLLSRASSKPTKKRRVRAVCSKRK